MSRRERCSGRFRAHEGGGLYRHLHLAGDGWWGPSLSKEPAWEDRRHLFFNELALEPDWRAGHQPGLGVLTVLDVDAGNVRLLTAEVEALLRGHPSSSCGWRSMPTFPEQCRIAYGGRVIREGGEGWLRYLGVVDPAGDIDLRGITQLAVEAEPDPPPPPSRDEMVGPLLLYEVYRPHPTTPRLAIAHDAGTGTSWTLRRRDTSRFCSPPQAAAGGLVACNGSELLHVAVDGQTETLVPGVTSVRHRVAPSGGMVAVEINGDIFVLDVPSGEETLRVEIDEFSRPSPHPA